MKLYIGGRAQGKLEYVLNKYNIEEKYIIDGKELQEKNDSELKVINHYNLFIKRMLQEKKDPLQITRCIIQKNPEILIISDEVGYGIVPIHKEERDYREIVGRVMCEVAKEAKSVERVICGIGQKIK